MDKAELALDKLLNADWFVEPGAVSIDRTVDGGIYVITRHYEMYYIGQGGDVTRHYLKTHGPERVFLD